MKDLYNNCVIVINNLTNTKHQTAGKKQN